MYAVPSWDTELIRRHAPYVALAATITAIALGLALRLTLGSIVGRTESVTASVNQHSVAMPSVPNTGAAAASTDPKNREPVISFNLVDGFQSAYDEAFPLFERARMHVTFVVNPAYVGYLGYVNAAQLAYVAKHGEEVVYQDAVSLPGASVLDVGSTTTFDGIAQRIDDAARDGEWLVISFHRINEPRTRDGKNVSLELVRRVIAYVKNSGIAVATNRDALLLMREK